MKLKTLSILAGVSFIALGALMGCGGNNNNVPAVANGSCAAGQVLTQFGCVAQAQANQCPNNGQIYGFHNGQCIQTSALGGTGVPGGVCHAGQVQTQQYGCQPTAAPGQCPMNGQTYAWYLGQCIVGTHPGGYNPGVYNPGYQNPTYTQNQCGAGAVYTQYGCLPQNGCQPGYGSINGGCIPAIQQGGYNTGGYNTGGYNGGAGAGFYFNYGTNTNQGCPYGYVYYMGYCYR